MSNVDFAILQRGIVGKGVGTDTYVLSNNLVQDNAKITLSDSGFNTLHLIDGLEIASSKVAANALLLTLSNGAEITVLDAASYEFVVGGDPITGETGTSYDLQGLASNVLGVEVPTSGIASGGNTTLGQAASSSSDAVIESTMDTLVVQRGITGKGSGHDTYVLSNNWIEAGAEITITDTGNNTIQFIDGLEVASSMVAPNALMLTLSNGATVTVLDADEYTFEVGGNPLENGQSNNYTFTELVTNTLNTDMPSVGDVSISNNFIFQNYLKKAFEEIGVFVSSDTGLQFQPTSSEWDTTVKWPYLFSNDPWVVPGSWVGVTDGYDLTSISDIPFARTYRFFVDGKEIYCGCNRLDVEQLFVGKEITAEITFKSQDGTSFSITSDPLYVYDGSLQDKPAVSDVKHIGMPDIYNEHDEFVLIDTDLLSRSLSDYSEVIELPENFSFNTDSDKIYAPASWVGNYELNVSPNPGLPNGWGRQVALKDIMVVDSPLQYFNAIDLSGVTKEHPILNYDFNEELLNELKDWASDLNDLGVTDASIWWWTNGFIEEDGSITMLDPSGVNPLVSNPLGFNEVKYLKEQLSKYDINLHIEFGCQMYSYADGSTYYPEITEANFFKEHIAWLDFLDRNQDYFNDLDPESIFLPSSSFFNEYSSAQFLNLQQEFYQNQLNIAEYIQENFSTKIKWLYSEEAFAVDGFKDSIDIIQYDLNPSFFDKIDLESLTSEIYYNLLKQSEEYEYLSFLVGEHDDVIINFTMQPRLGWFDEPYYIEETAETYTFYDPFSDSIDPRTSGGLTVSQQDRVIVDWSLQALVYDATLRALSELQPLGKITISAGDFWVAENLIKIDDPFPYFASSSRNKPSEIIIFEWFTGDGFNQEELNVGQELM